MSKDNISKEIESKFGNQLRIRVNGILIQNEKLLMIKHRMGNGRILWSVPGGGMQFGQDAKSNLIREFEEETGFLVTIENYLFVHEFLNPPLHALEHFFLVKWISGDLKLGTDPELEAENQIIEETRWMSLKDIQTLSKKTLHPVFWGIKSLSAIGLYKGYFNFENIYIK